MFFLIKIFKLCIQLPTHFILNFRKHSLTSYLGFKSIFSIKLCQTYAEPGVLQPKMLEIQ